MSGAPVQTAPAAIVQRERAPLAFVPSNVDEAWRIAELLAKSALLPDSLRGKPHDVLVAVLTGAELGISPMQATREIHVVKGRPFIAALLRVALVRQSPECVLWQLVESTPRWATFRTQRRGDPTPTTMTYTIEEAEAAGLVAQNPKYRTDPALQLRRRCQGRLTDEVFPDVIRGIGAREDVEEEIAAEREQRRAIVQPPHLRVTQEAPQAPPSPAPVEDAEIVEPDATAPTEPSPATGEPSPLDLLSLAIAQAQTPREVAAVGQRIAAATGIPEEGIRLLRAEFLARQREVRQ